MKKTISAVLSIVIILGILFCADFISFAALQTTDIQKTRLGTTDTYYSFNSSTKTLTISGEGDTPNFSNDDSSQPWYNWRSDGSIEHVVVEEGITSLGNHFFYYVGAEDFILPSTLVSIGNYAMSGINSATSIDLPEGLVKIGDGAFCLSVGIEGITIPKSVTSIGASAFENCFALSSVAFEDMNSNIKIGSRAFFSCKSLKSVTVPKRANLLSYSFGFYRAAAGYVYSDFVLNVYRDSPAYTYAVKKIVNPDNYNIINEFVISDGQTVDCTYYEDSLNDKMIFVFIPTVSDCYRFFSTGDVDVDCVLYDNSGTEIAKSSDISLDDLNFSIDCFLQAGETYRYTVNCVSRLSIGDFAVNMITSHCCEAVVTPPSLTEDGYTTYTCIYCGISYQGDFVKRTGILITGRVVLMENPDGSHPNNYPVFNADVDIDGVNKVKTDINGEFSFYAEKGSREISIGTDYSVIRTIDITYDENMEMPLGEITLFNFDYYTDGYVNAKDFAVFRSFYGSYPPGDSRLASIDYNRDGEINYNDFELAKSFIAYGKISESIYN